MQFNFVAAQIKAIYLYSGMSKVASFRIKYDGPALQEHSIDINDLAPALMALNDFMGEANKIVNGDRAGISLKVKALEGGSFNIDISAAQSVWDHAQDLITGKSVTTVATILAIIGFSGKDGVIQVCKFLKGKRPTTIKEVNPSAVVITNYANNSITINKIELNIYNSPIARKAIYQIVKPLEKEGIDSVGFLEGHELKSVIRKEEAPYFNPSAIEQEIQESIKEVYVNIEHAWLSGNEKGKWKFKEGSEGASWNAQISDQDFLLELLKGGVSLSGADRLKVRVKQTQYQTGSGIKSEYEIIKVLEHSKGLIQLPLGLKQSTDSE